MFKVSLLLVAIFICINVSAQSNGFGRGYYYDSNNQKNVGFLQLNPVADYLKFKKDSIGKAKKIKIAEIKSVVVENDSLVVLQEGNSKSNRYFGKLIVTTPNTSF